MISTNPVIVNIVPVVVAGSALLSVIANCSPVSGSFAYTILTHFVQADVNSASVGAVV